MVAIDKLQYGLVKRPCKRETEVRVVSAEHVIEVLMRHRFYYSRRHFGSAGFRIVAVVDFPAVPFLVFSGNITLYSGKQRVGEV